MNLTKADIGIQVSPVSIEHLCRYGMYGKVEKVTGGVVRVQWASGRAAWMDQSQLEPVPAVSTQSEEKS